MICPLCQKKGIRVVSPCWFKEKTIEACYNCIKKFKLKSIEIKYKRDDGIRIPFWKVDVPAKLDKLAINKLFKG